MALDCYNRVKTARLFVENQPNFRGVAIPNKGFNFVIDL